MEKEKLISLIGIAVQIGICYALSTDRKKINWKLVTWGITLQVIFAFLILKTPQGQDLFGWLNDVVVRMLSFSTDGAKFIFGELVNFVVPVNVGDASVVPELAQDVSMLKLTATTGAYFAFNVLPTIIFFSAVMTILYHLGIMQRLVYYVAMVMQKTMKTSGAESLSAAANIFVGQTEAPLVIKPYIDKMTFSELNCIMAGGMATIAGGVMAAYVGILKDTIPGIAGHLIAASVMSAPAALVFAKILVPETEIPETSGSLELRVEKIDQNVIDAAARGCSEGMSLALNVAAMLIGFIAIIAMGNHIWKIIAETLGITHYTSIESVIGIISAPFAWLLGIPYQDIFIAGELLGKKVILNEFVAYADLGKILNGGVMQDGLPVELAMRSRIILSYALCGFANLGSIGIQLGGIGGIAPARRGDLARLSFRALLAGSFACFLTANIAGMLID